MISDVTTVATRSSGVGQLGSILATLWRRSTGPFRPRVVSAVGGSDVGRVRDNNEDYLLMADLARPARSVRGTDRTGAVAALRPLLVVADGMGGAAGGEVASAMAANIVCSQLENAARAGRLRSAWQWRKSLADAFDLANRRIRERGDADAALRGMGTTATAVALYRNSLYIAHVGDSRAYLLRAGTVRRLTRDHTWLQYVLDAGRPQDAGEDDPRRNALLRALGTQAEVTVDFGRVELRPHDTVILCTDGLWSVVEDDELARLVSSHADLGALCERLLSLANDRGGRDNVTVLAARLEPRFARLS